MQPGSFYCFVPKKGVVSGWLPFCKNSQRSVYRRINAILSQYCHRLSLILSMLAVTALRETKPEVNTSALDESDLYHCNQVDKETVSLVYPGAGLTVRSGIVELTSHVWRSEPNVYSTEKAFIVLRGYISNVEDLCLSMGRMTSPLKCLLVDNAAGKELPIGEVAARLILTLYMEDTAKDPLLVLSELQGNFAFVIYDSEDKTIFAARDASGNQPLYVTTENEKNIALSNTPLNAETDGAEWMEIPPGFYLYGRHPQLQQFALTADELTARWSMDLDDAAELNGSMDSATDNEHRRSWSFGLVGSFRNRISPQTLHDVARSLPQTL